MAGIYVTSFLLSVSSLPSSALRSFIVIYSNALGETAALARLGE